MSYQTKFWQTLRPLRKVGKLRGVIDVPAFTLVSGNKSCLSLSTEANGGFPVQNDFAPTTAFSFVFWIKSASYNQSGTAQIVFGTDAVSVRIANGCLLLTVQTDDAYNLQSTNKLTPDVWTHVAIVYENNVATIYINGVFDCTSSNFGVGNIQAPGWNTGFANFCFGSTTLNTPGFDTQICYLSNVQLWETSKGQLEIIEGRYKLPYSGGGMGLVGLYLFREYDNVTYNTRNWVTGTVYSSSETGGVFANDYPYDLYNCSFIVGQFPIDTGGKKFSFVFPVAKPSNANFVLCVSRPSDGKRFYFWIDDEFKISIPMTKYNGEKLDDGSVIEIWSLANSETASSADVIELTTSIMNVVSDPSSTARTSEATLTLNSELAAQYPLPFPIQFNTQQTYPGNL